MEPTTFDRSLKWPREVLESWPVIYFDMSIAKHALQVKAAEEKSKPALRLSKSAFASKLARSFEEGCTSKHLELQLLDLQGTSGKHVGLTSNQRFMSCESSKVKGASDWAVNK